MFLPIVPLISVSTADLDLPFNPADLFALALIDAGISQKEAAILMRLGDTVPDVPRVVRMCAGIESIDLRRLALLPWRFHSAFFSRWVGAMARVFVEDMHPGRASLPEAPKPMMAQASLRTDETRRCAGSDGRQDSQSRRCG